MIGDKKMLKLIYFIILATFVSCGPELPEVTTESNNEGSYYPQAPITFQADIYGFEGMEFSSDGKNLFSEDVSSGYLFSLSNKPSFLNINTTTGELSGELVGSRIYEGIIIRAIKISDSSVISKTFSIAVNGDPLRQYAWNLNNTGQKSFAFLGGEAGIDINVFNVWKDGITGSGVKIAVSDSGVEINHDDLYQNGLDGEHRDYSLHSPYTGNPVPTSAHGTAVTGIIGAKGWNNTGSIGVAPNAKFGGFQFLNSSQSTSILVSQASGDFDIFNYSYGDTLFEDTISDSTYIDHLRYSTITDNKVYVKAAGNEHMLGEGTLCAPHNANLPYENESPFIIMVGAINADGVKSTYSNVGSNLWVSAPGGEFGITYPAIITADLPTCLKGYSKANSSQANSFEYGHALNTNCHYTSVMNGTSSATPHVTGVIALMREANPALKMRDIKHILATTSVKVNPSHTNNYFGKYHPSTALSGCEDLNLDGYEYEQGWVKNKANIWFNNFYGFGLIDAKAAVEAAKVYVSTIGSLVELNANFTNGTYQGVVNKTIPDADAEGLEDSLNIASTIKAESVQVYVKATHNKSGQLGVELTSPLGTKSILLNINNSLLFDGDKNLSVVLNSNAFYGESVIGNWTVRLIDGQGGVTGTLNEWRINILGHN